MNLNKVTPGQDLKISASDWNWFCKTAEAFRNGKLTQNQLTGITPYSNAVVSVSCADMISYGTAVVINSQMDLAKLQIQAQNKYSYINKSPLSVLKCELIDGFKPTGIVVKGSKAQPDDGYNTAAQAVFSGLAIARFDTEDFNSEHKRAYCGEDGKLISSNVGQHAILFELSEDEATEDSGSEDKFAIIQVNDGLVNTLKCKITGANPFGSDERKWSYTFEEVKRNSSGWTTVTDGVTDAQWAEALNGMEANNSGGETMQSNSYDFGEQPLLSATGFDIVEIRGQPVVTMTFSIDDETGDKYCDFEASNIIIGEC